MLHPFLIAAFPAVSLFAHNVYETEPRELVAPIVLATAGALAAWLALAGLTRDARRAGLMTSLLVAAFFSFGLALNAVNLAAYKLSKFWVPFGDQDHPWLTLALMSAAFGPGLVLIARRLRDPGRWTAALNGFAVLLVALPSGSAALAKLREPARPSPRLGNRYPVAAGRTTSRPDIYYIVLDSYARSDVMKELYGFDNGPFLRRLEERGFYVAGRSTSNYCYTPLSLASSLNADYLDALLAPGSRDLTPLTGLIGSSRVVNSLRPLGYEFVSFSTGFEPTEHPEADVYLAPLPPWATFHRLLIDMTPIASFGPDSGRATWDRYAGFRDRTLFLLDRLPGIASRTGPTFTLAHFVCPHPPFVFGDDGRDVSPRGGGHFERRHDPDYYRASYRAQAAFITERIERVIERILAESPEPPIIILQSDHGPGLRHHIDDLESTDLRERMSILNCFYFPGGDYRRLDDRITPVDSFRVVLDQFFGSDVPLLEPRNYFSLSGEPLRLIDVTDRLRAEQEHPAKHAPAPYFPNTLD